MMIPPLVRVGPPIQINPREELVVLVRNRGWLIVKWMPQGYLLDQDREARPRMVDPLDVVCWMPQDGS